jgi:hypothetical protein
MRMTEVKKIVVEHCPVDRLPEELRRGLESGQMVRVVVEAELEVPTPRPLREFFGCAKTGLGTPEEAVAAVRALRDEWN